MGVAGSSGDAFSLEYISTDTSTLGTTHTFSGVSLGDPSPNRIIIVSVQQSNDNTPPSFTIGGVTATQIITKLSGNTRATIYAAAVPSGATGDIVGTGASMALRIGWYTMIMPSGSTTPTNTGSTSVSSGNISLFCTVPTNGVGVVIVADDATGGHTATNYTEDFDGTDGGGFDSGTGGTFTASTTLTCQNTTSNTDNKALVYASWGP